MIRLFSPPNPKKSAIPQNIELSIEGEMVSIAVRQNNRAKYYGLRLDVRKGPVLTIPKGGNFKEAQAFLAKNRNWLDIRVKRMEFAKPFYDGQVIPIRGADHLIVHEDLLRGQVKLIEEEERPVVLVPGDLPHLDRRLTDWLKKQARADLTARSDYHSDRLDLAYTAISMRAQSTRWGSCSANGSLSYNWRLILAPEFVLDYVAAHEVAHLREMNHSQAFWDTVGETLPDMARGRAWLKANGSALFAYGVN